MAETKKKVFFWREIPNSFLKIFGTGERITFNYFSIIVRHNGVPLEASHPFRIIRTKCFFHRQPSAVELHLNLIESASNFQVLQCIWD